MSSLGSLLRRRKPPLPSMKIIRLRFLLCASTIATLCVACTPHSDTSPLAKFGQACTLRPGLRPNNAKLRSALTDNRRWALANRHQVSNADIPTSVYLGFRYPPVRSMSSGRARPATLCYADLSHRDFSHLAFSHLNLSYANLAGANLSYANLTGANLTAANLVGANVDFANLSRATLSYAALDNADLLGTNLANATFTHTDLSYADYEPAAEPPSATVVHIFGLETLKTAHDRDVTGMVQLRKLLADAGFVQDVRAISSAIQRNTTAYYQGSSFSWGSLSALGRFIAFDITTAYGLSPERALKLIFILGSLLVPVYMRAIITTSSETSSLAGIYKDLPVSEPDAKNESRTKDDGAHKRLRATGWHAFWWAAYFSLLSSVNIGFEQFTPGEWIRRLQLTEYTLRPVGWVRVVSGAQSLLSVYLLAIWVLTRFGNLFQ